jgi:hypothetical protein
MARAERLFAGEREGRKARWLVVFGALRRVWFEGSVVDCWGVEDLYGFEEPNQSSWAWLFVRISV